MKHLLDEKKITSEEHEVRMRAARAVARWELGDPGWAGRIIGAYMFPDEAMAKLRVDMGEGGRP